MKIRNTETNALGATVALDERPAKPAPEKSAEQLAAENAELRQQLAEHEAQDEQAAKDEEIILAKMSVGLSRPQAEAVVKRQRMFNADILPNHAAWRDAGRKKTAKRTAAIQAALKI